MKCRGVKKIRKLVTRYCIFEEKRREGRGGCGSSGLFLCPEILKRKCE